MYFAELTLLGGLVGLALAVLGLAVALIGGSLTSYLFARRAANLKPADALRNQ